MKIVLKTTKKEEIEYLQEMKLKAYSVNKRYFENGILPGKLDNIECLFNDEEYDLLTIYLDDKIIGALAVKEFESNKRQIDSFYIAEEYQNKNLGSIALKKVEELYPNTKIWRLVTPTQLMKNIVFYINKCGYTIIKVYDYNREKENGWYLFEKNINNN